MGTVFVVIACCCCTGGEILLGIICGSLFTGSRTGGSTIAAIGTTGAGSGVFNVCGEVAAEVTVLVVVGIVVVVEATDCLRARPIRFNCVDGTPMLY